MAYKDLLVVLDNSAAGLRRIDLAAALAEQFGAHLIGLHPRPQPRFSATFGYYDPTLFDPLYREIAERLQQESDALRRRFEHAAELRGVSAEWRSPEIGGENNPAIHIRYVDLAIFGQRDPDRPSDELLRFPPEAAALASGRPILVIPYAGNFASLGRRVLIGWNASREATRAVNDAMPLLEKADKVTVLVIDPAAGGHGEDPGADVSLHLARHGVKAEVERTSAADIAVADVLLSRAADLGADLLVMGLYGHSRARELLLGGASRGILGTMTIPVLMSH
ncbi:MAG TPA: universal stress protein [Stellaceae bacterium]|nr:universal stress protein [Stellaceae bacterium]